MNPWAELRRIEARLSHGNSGILDVDRLVAQGHVPQDERDTAIEVYRCRRAIAGAGLQSSLASTAAPRPRMSQDRLDETERRYHGIQQAIARLTPAQARALDWSIGMGARPGAPTETLVTDLRAALQMVACLIRS